MNRTFDARPDGSPAWRRRWPLALEQTAAFELGELLASPIYYGLGAPRGNGRLVLLIPGFLGADGYLGPLANWLSRVGYRPRHSGVVIAAGSLPSLLRHTLDRVEQLAMDGQRLTIIGHSIGGVFGRMAAVSRPDLVEQVIALGAPLNGDPREAAHPLIRVLGELMLPRSGAAERRALALLASPLPRGVRLTSIYTRRDAVIDWRTCIDTDPRSDNVEVQGSHLGLAWNAGVYRRLSLLLAAP